MDKIPTDDEGSGYVDRSAEWRGKVGLGNVTSMVPPNAALVEALRGMLRLAENGDVVCMYGLAVSVDGTRFWLESGTPPEPFSFHGDLGELAVRFTNQVMKDKD